MYNNSFELAKLEDVCPQLTYNYHVESVNENRVNTLIVSFNGKYRDGSAGRPDAGFMKGIVVTGMEIWDPISVIIDLRALEYRWGDNINSVFAAVTKINSAIIVGENNRRGLSTLEFGTHTREDIVDNEFFFESVDEAIQELNSNS